MAPRAVGKAFLVPALAVSMVLAGSVAAQAATSARASAARPDAEVVVFTGHTYPDTVAGLAACHAEGLIYAESGAGVADCWLGMPDPGLYGLYMVRTIP